MRGGEGEGLVGGKVKIAQQNFKSKKKIHKFFSPNCLKNVLTHFFLGGDLNLRRGGPNLRRGGRGGLHSGKGVEGIQIRRDLNP